LWLATSLKCAFGQNDNIKNDVLVGGSNEFGYDLAKNLHNHDKSSNLWLSPFCISSCFSLVYPGSRGKTQSQISNVMGYPTDNSFDVTKQFFALQSLIESTYSGPSENDDRWARKKSIVGIANKIYASKSLTLKQEYVDALDDGRESFIESDFDFEADDAVTIINQWVNKSTNGLIDSIVDQVNPDWRLVALNAIYLNGTFQSQFKKHMTSSNAFYSDTSRTEKVADCHLMHQIKNFDYFSDGRHQFLKFPFSDSEDLFVLFALPIADNSGFISDKQVIDDVLTKLESTYIALALPKLSIETSYDLNKPLMELGIKDAFTSNADFSGMSETEKLQIDQVIHKTMVEMDENGLVAAAVTMIAMMKMSMMMDKPTPILFKADHPFQLFIIDGEHNNAILFMGNVNEPGIPKESETPTFDESSNPIWKVPKKQVSANEEPIPESGMASWSDSCLTSAIVVSAICTVATLILFYHFRF